MLIFYFEKSRRVRIAYHNMYIWICAYISIYVSNFYLLNESLVNNC